MEKDFYYHRNDIHQTTNTKLFKKDVKTLTGYSTTSKIAASNMQALVTNKIHRLEGLGCQISTQKYLQHEKDGELKV